MSAIGSDVKPVFIDANGVPVPTDKLAPKNSPAFTGKPTAPTAADTTTGTTQIATLAFVITRISNWWSNVCTNVATTVSKLWTFSAGISAASVTDTGVKSAALIGTDSNGKIITKTLSKTTETWTFEALDGTTTNKTVVTEVSVS